MEPTHSPILHPDDARVLDVVPADEGDGTSYEPLDHLGAARRTIELMHADTVSDLAKLRAGREALNEQIRSLVRAEEKLRRAAAVFNVKAES